MSSRDRQRGKAWSYFLKRIQCILLLLQFLSTAIEALNSEGMALLAFKNSVQDPDGSLKSWDAAVSTNPCSWEGIQCNTVTNVVTSINLGRHHLQGQIAPELGELTNLRRLALHYNNLNGSIPTSFGNLTRTRAMYLHHNNLSGSIPDGLAKMISLQRLSDWALTLGAPEQSSSTCFAGLIMDLSNNELSGPIPTAILLRFNSSSFSGNPNLCVSIKEQQQEVPICPATSTTGPSPAISPSAAITLGHQKTGSAGLSLLQIVLLSVGVFLLLKLVLGLLLLRHWMKTDTKLEINVGTGGKLVMFQSGVIVPSSREMFRAISRVRKRDIVGEGAYGVVYKLVLKDDSVFAVKKLKQCLENQRSFENELNTLATVKHRNLVRLRGFCTAPQSKLLIYDFLPNGSVDELLHEKSTELKVVNWVIRYRVAIGVARGLAYLHHGCDPSIIHGDISSTNILLDHHFEPHISDFGLAKLLDSSDTHITATVGGTFGYIAPEYAKTGQATEKVDVYSYGVLLLEILSGRRPTDDFFTVTEDHVNLAGWVRNLCKEGHESDVVDTYLKDRTPYEALRLLLEVACQCVSLLPQDRPSMTKVVESLETLTDNIESVSSSSCLQTPNSELWPSVGETTSFNSGSFRFCNEVFNQAEVLEAGFVGIKGEPFLFDLAL